MIVKFMGNKGGGSASASLNYLLNKPEGTMQILQGNPELSKRIAESLNFKNKYTVGVLSFEEKSSKFSNLEKREIMEKFENVIFAGLNKDQYNITWIEHTDKERLELNFFIPNVEMTTGKRLQPYYDKVDRQLVDSFKKVINYEHNLSDPDNPSKRQAHKTETTLPKTKQERLRAIESQMLDKILNEGVKDRQSVIEGLKSLNYEIVRISEKYISIKDPNGGQNLRLKGEIYEQSFDISKGLGESLRERSEKYGNEREESYRTARTRLDSEVNRKIKYNENRYGSNGKVYQNRLSDIEASNHGRNQQNNDVDQPIKNKDTGRDGILTEQKNQMDSMAKNNYSLNSDNWSRNNNTEELFGNKRSGEHNKQSYENNSITEERIRNIETETNQTEIKKEIENDNSNGRAFIENIKRFGQEILGRANSFIESIKEFGERLFKFENELRQSADTVSEIEYRTSENERTISKNEQDLQREEIKLEQVKSKEKELV